MDPSEAVPGAPGAPPVPGVSALPPVIPPYPHDTELSVITVGTGNPHPNLERASACTMVQYRGKYYMVDMGNGAQNSMLRGTKGAFPTRDIAAFCFTHFHQDHTNDFFDLMTNRWMTGGREVTIVGPPGAAALHEFFITFFHDDLCYRMLRELRQGKDGTGVFEGVTVREVVGAQRFRLGELQVRTAKLTHTMYDLGYRFEADGRAVVVSGDTAYDERLIELAKDADVLVADCDERWGGNPDHTIPVLEELEPRYRPRGEYGGDFRVQPHATLQEVGAMAAGAGVKHLVMTHLRGGPVDEQVIRAGVRAAGFAGRVTVAFDGMEVAV